VRVILGRMGETLPFFLWRLDQRAGAFAEHAPELTPSQLVRRNIRITTAGSFSDEPLRCALDALGEDNVMYSIDYPFESMTEPPNGSTQPNSTRTSARRSNTSTPKRC
jgi:2,3-dihydroxybenzoate decarboxylase